jgi:hypothetical protein
MPAAVSMSGHVMDSARTVCQLCALVSRCSLSFFVCCLTAARVLAARVLSQGQKPVAGLSKRPSVRKIVKPKTKAQLEEEAAASLATTVWDMTDR